VCEMGFKASIAYSIHHSYRKDADRAVEVRRAHLARALASEGVGSDTAPATANLPHHSFSTRHFYKSIKGANCEAVIG
jgi:hypothetical protein